MFVCLAKGGEEKFTCLLCNLCLASGPELLCCWFGVNQMSQSQEPGPGLSQVRFLLAAVQERCPTRICGVEGACCVRAAEVVSRHIPPNSLGMLRREGGLLFDLFGEPGFRNSRKQFSASVPSCSCRFFSGDGSV